MEQTARELVMARWGMPGPPQFGGAPITNIRDVARLHYRGGSPLDWEPNVVRPHQGQQTQPAQHTQHMTEGRHPFIAE